MAFALLAVATIAVAGAQPPVDAPLRLFPIRPAWHLSLNNVLTVSPVLTGRRGYFPIEGDRLAAYDIEYGTLLWLVPARAQAQPAVGDGLVFVIEPDRLVAFDATTGSIAWQVPFNEPLAAPLVWDNGWLVGTARSGTVVAFRAQDGGLIWRQELQAPIRGAAALAADRVYVAMEDGRVIALRVDTGEPIWTRKLGAAPNEMLALEESVYVGSNDNFVYSLRARDGFVSWRFSTGADVVGRPVVDDRRVYFVSFDNLLRALDRHSGSQRWKRALPLRPTRGPVVSGDTLIVSGLSSTPQAYAIKDGTPVGEIAAEGELAAAPHVVPNDALPMLLLVTRDIEAGTILRAVVRAIDPPAGPVGPLPSAFSPPIPVAPPTTP